ncbi:MAG: nuclear transport factor 2 family protein [Actinomycetota bacterium]|nr:nuclear transport factor 2 family protein [Actinomycetota bacterium]
MSELDQGAGPVGANTLLARKAFEALDQQDVGAFVRLCDDEVELSRFTAPPDEQASRSPEYAMVPIQGRQMIATWLQKIFDAHPAMRFVLEAADPVGGSVFCDARFSFGKDPSVAMDLCPDYAQGAARWL